MEATSESGLHDTFRELNSPASWEGLGVGSEYPERLSRNFPVRLKVSASIFPVASFAEGQAIQQHVDAQSHENRKEDEQLMPARIVFFDKEKPGFPPPEIFDPLVIIKQIDRTAHPAVMNNVLAFREIIDVPACFPNPIAEIGIFPVKIILRIHALTFDQNLSPRH